MKVPKYIEYALEQRTKAAVRFQNYDSMISNYIDEHNIEVDEFDYRTGVESLCNPWDSSNRVRRAIQQHNE